MIFTELCGYFERIEATTKRLEKTVILAELLKKIEVGEVRVVINLALGQLAAPYLRIQSNLAEKMLIRAIAQSVRMSTDDVTAKFKEMGDLGELVRELGNATTGRVSSTEALSTTEVYEQLLAIAHESGSGSQERKQTKLVHLLSQSSAVEAKYIVRMVNESLRLGFSESTMLDVLSYFACGNKDYSERLEKAYQMRPDVALLGEEVVGEGVDEALSKASVFLGVPIIPALAQRLSSVDEMIEKMGRVYVEPKLDGTRVQIHYSRMQQLSNATTMAAKTGQLSQASMFEAESFDVAQDKIWVKTYTRNLDENTEQFPELMLIERELAAESVILDAEAVGYDPDSGELLPFQMTITRKRKHGISEQQKNIPLRFFVFDIMYLNGVTLINKPLRERRQILESVLKPDVILALNPQIETDQALEIREYHANQLSEGLEGVLVKKVDGTYDPGRSGFNWVKLKEIESAEGKLSDTIDCVVMGYYRGRGKRSNFGMGAFLVGIKGKDEAILTIAKIGTGLTDEQFRELYAKLQKLEVRNSKLENYEVSDSLIPDVWVKPEVVVEIAADEITVSPSHSAKYALRFPRLVKFRDDKSVKEITTLDEIEAMYGQ
ncbi:ATP-dependent DNA ligase [Candidatus Woesebacteria bacterium]|nr:ATP-dependent DNA ligase [Candidatus Woesebacteria bacterium]